MILFKENSNISLYGLKYINLITITNKAHKTLFRKRIDSKHKKDVGNNQTSEGVGVHQSLNEIYNSVLRF
ncbi:hypothetical protein EMIT074MI3_11208 [Bacillus licheniformis]|jgi:hypothetical protein